jgi:spore coat polysaccharide biosynthesis predicted glycosyltransferase SpsG
MTKKIKAVLPSYAYEIAMGIIKDNGLIEREKSISEQLKNTTDFEIAKSIADDIPSLILARITRMAVEENLSEKEVTSLLSEKLRIEKEKAEKINTELQKKIIFFTEAVEIIDEDKKEVKKNEVINEKIDKEKETQKKKKKAEKINLDPYREEIE